MKKAKLLYKQIQEHPILKYLGNKYFLSSFFFAIWMTFLDTHSLLIHRELNAEIEELERGIEYYSTELKQDKEFLNELQNKSDKFEKFAREQYWLKKSNEDIYLIERVE